MDHKTKKLVDLLRLSAYLLYQTSLYVGPNPHQMHRNHI